MATVPDHEKQFLYRIFDNSTLIKNGQAISQQPVGVLVVEISEGVGVAFPETLPPVTVGKGSFGINPALPG